MLLFIALVLPVPGAILLRLLAHRFDQRWFFGAAAALFGLALGSVLILSRADVGVLRVGSLTLLLSSSRPAGAIPLPPDLVINEGDPQPAPEPPPFVPPTLTPRPSATATSAPTATIAPTAIVTPEPEPTLEPTPEPTPEPTATLEPTPVPTNPPPAAGPRRYTVQPGDTFRAIAERFGVSVADLLRVNNLTPAQADALRVGQELVIP
ncbi:MAG: LysM peptidoglycan-binding domain-containing protein [Oscillochloridaceae bacterium umkhey_bin13]